MRKAVAVVVFISLFFSIATATPDRPVYKMATKVLPEPGAISTRWAFVIDTSQSIVRFNLFGGILSGFTKSTVYPTDQFKFCMYAFNNQNCWSYRKWNYLPAYKDVDGKVTKKWRKLIGWIYGNTGTMSYGSGAINDALHQKVTKLTIVIISDGGFTEGGTMVMKIIKDAQEWRVAEGYGRAVITTIGIENMACRPIYPKPNNAICQKWMRDIGVTGLGGYRYVYRNKLEGTKTTKTTSQKEE